MAMAAWSARAGDTKAAYELGCKDYTDAKDQADLTDAAATKAIKTLN